MRALAIAPGAPGVRLLVDHPEPSIAAPDEVKVRVLRVGICGTDREEAAGGRARPPDGRQALIIGHEMLGEVVAVGETVTRVRPGDYAVFTVRRGCSRCLPCTMNRPDMCRTGDFRERGIWGLDGYQTEYVVDREQYAVRVPPELASTGVLAEPLSVAEKAVDEAVRLQSARLPDAPPVSGDLSGLHCLVAGSVNAARHHVEMGVEDLARARLRWGDRMSELITHRYPSRQFSTALGEHPPDEIKAVVEWTTS